MAPAVGAADGRADVVEREVLRAITPTPAFLERLASVRGRLLNRAEEAARSHGMADVRCLIAGSAARGGFLSDRVDIDLFLLFPPDLPRDRLERDGLALAAAILPRPETRYAEHPYLRGEFEGFQVDAVPGYAVADGAQPQSAVDRTPFHQAYLEARETPELIDQVRLTKQFLRSLGVYGSEARTLGCSGYLVELLVLRYGSLRGLLRAARTWRPPVRLSEGSAAPPRVPEGVPLILADPVDPARNVSSALSRANLARLVLAAGAYLDRPTPEAFAAPAPRSLARAEGLTRLAHRRTHVAVVAWNRPALVDDVLYPQLRRAERGVLEAATRLGFQPIGSGVGADDQRLLVGVEVAHAELAEVRVRDGPPAGLDRSGSFLEKWSEAPREVLQGPYVREDGSLGVETRRPERRLEALLTAELPQIPLGQDLRRASAAGFHPLADEPEGPALALLLQELLGKGLPAWIGAAAPRSDR